MPETISDNLRRLADHLRYIGKGDDATMVNQLAVICDIKGIRSVEDLSAWNSAVQGNQRGLGGMEQFCTPGGANVIE